MTLAIDAAALALAAALFATPVAAQVTAPPRGLPNVSTTKVIAIGSVTAKWTPDAIRTVMPAEVRDTVRLYLAGKVDQWYVRRDRQASCSSSILRTRSKRRGCSTTCRSAGRS